MNRKIKSVKLAKDYRTAHKEILKGHIFCNRGNYWIGDSNFKEISFHKSEVFENKTGLFDIEYENEHFEFRSINVTEHCAENKYYKNFLNALADWCEAKCNPNKLLPVSNTKYSVYVDRYNDMKVFEDCDIYFKGGIKFYIRESAELFLSELNRNKREKKYYIALLTLNRIV